MKARPSCPNCGRPIATWEQSVKDDNGKPKHIVCPQEGTHRGSGPQGRVEPRPDKGDERA